MVLLERDAWSAVKRLRQATNGPIPRRRHGSHTRNQRWRSARPAVKSLTMVFRDRGDGGHTVAVIISGSTVTASPVLKIGTSMQYQ